MPWPLILQHQQQPRYSLCKLRTSLSFPTLTSTSPVCKQMGQKLPGGWSNIKMSSYQHRKSHSGDKTILRPSYLHNGISYTGKMTSLYLIRAQITVSVDVLAPNESVNPSTGTVLTTEISFQVFFFFFIISLIFLLSLILYISRVSCQKGPIGHA